MDPQSGGSFIPKKPLIETRRGGGGLLFSIALLLFIASLAGGAAVFAYQGYLTTTIASKDESLKKTESAFDPDAIETLVRTDRRIEEMRILLSKHVAPSAIFALLSELTLQSVRYNSFRYTLEPSGAASISLQGVADSFSSVALQSDQFGASKYLSNVVFSGISINSSGRVDFTVGATVAPSAVSYSRQLLDPAQSLVPQAPGPSRNASSSPATTTRP